VGPTKMRASFGLMRGSIFLSSFFVFFFSNGKRKKKLFSINYQNKIHIAQTHKNDSIFERFKKQYD
jgi:hypothetical protein